MELRVWQSFSCNNSSSFHLIARFGDPVVAKDAEKELNAVFKAHAEEFDEIFEETDDFPRKPSKAVLDFATKNGFVWKSQMVWGDEALAGDEPELTVDGSTLLIYHSYCGGGLPKEVDTYLKKRGAKIDKDQNDLAVSIQFTVDPKKKKALTKKLNELFLFNPKLKENKNIAPADPRMLVIPWGKRDTKRYGQIAHFFDGKTVGIYVPFVPRDVELIRTWVTKLGGTDLSLRVCEPTDFEKFLTIQKARCTECGGELEVLENDHLSCKPCGGMFDLATFLPKKPKKKSKKG